MVIQTKVITADGDLEALGIVPKQSLDVDLKDVIGVSEVVGTDKQCCLLFSGYNIIIERDYEQTRLEWLQTRKK